MSVAVIYAGRIPDHCSYLKESRYFAQMQLE